MVEGNGPAVFQKATTSHPCWEMMLLQLFKISKRKENVGQGRVMGVSLSFSWGDSSALVLFHFSVTGASTVRNPSTNKARPPPAASPQEIIAVGTRDMSRALGRGQTQGQWYQSSQYRADPTSTIFQQKGAVITIYFEALPVEIFPSNSQTTQQHQAVPRGCENHVSLCQ